MIPENQPQQPDDEAVHYRVCVDAIPTRPEPTPAQAPMTAEWMPTDEQILLRELLEAIEKGELLE